MSLQQTASSVSPAIAMLALAPSVMVTALILDLPLPYLALAVPGLALVGGELLIVAWAERLAPKTGNGTGEDSDLGVRTHGPTVVEGLVVQAITLLLFANLLDGGVHLKASLYAYLPYVAGAAIVLVRRAKSLTKGDCLYLKWGWGAHHYVWGPTVRPSVEGKRTAVRAWLWQRPRIESSGPVA